MNSFYDQSEKLSRISLLTAVFSSGNLRVWERVMSQASGVKDNKGYKKLRVWQEAHRLALLVYKIIQKFPKPEIFGLVSQIRRAIISVPANIVEGHTRESSKEFIRFLIIANGSLVEAEYYFELALDLKYINKKNYHEFEKQRKIVGGLLNGLIKSLKQKP